MAITPAYCVDEEELMSLKSLVETEGEVDDIYRDMEEDFRALLSKAAELGDGDDFSPYEELEWAESLEGAAREAAETMADQAEGIRRGVPVLALRPGEEAVVEALQRQAVLANARRAEAEEVVAAARRLQEKDLRRLAAEEHLNDPLLLWFLVYFSEKMGPSLLRGACLPTPEELADVEEAAVRTEERMAWLADRLRCGAAAFAARPGEEALVGALQRQATNADLSLAMVARCTACVRRFRAAGSMVLAGTEAGHANM